MPTKREREYYRMGFLDGQRASRQEGSVGWVPLEDRFPTSEPRPMVASRVGPYGIEAKPKRKLSAWNKFVKANSKKPRFRLRSGSPNLKKLGVAFRKTQKRGGKR